MGRAATILLVDDELLFRAGLGAVLESEGYRVIAAGNGAEALTALGAQPVDLILADVVMPGMDGYQFFRHVMRRADWRSIPFVFMTAHRPGDILAVSELGASGYITKPVDLDQLVDTLASHLRANSAPEAHAQRAAAHLAGADSWSLGRLQIDARQHRVCMDGEPVALSAREFRLLERLAVHANRIVSSEELAAAAYGAAESRTPAETLLRSLVRSLRRKLGYAPGDMGCIKNVHGVGYMLVPPR
jgi:DNA-binding response OmpR family regulator